MTAVTPPELFLDVAAVDRLRALGRRVARAGEDPFGDLVRLFARDGKSRIDAMRATTDGAERRRLAHACKGAAAQMGALRMAAAAAALEKDPADAGLIDEIERLFHGSLAALQAG